MAIRTFIAVSLYMIFVPCCSVWAAERQPDPVPDSAAATEPSIVFSILDPDEKVMVWNGTRLQMALLGGSAPSGIGVKSLKVSLPPALALKKRGDASKNVEIDVAAAMQLRAGERREFPPIELTPLLYAELDSQLLDILMYRPRKEAFVATLTYEALADKKQGTK